MREGTAHMQQGSTASKGSADFLSKTKTKSNIQSLPQHTDKLAKVLKSRIKSNNQQENRTVFVVLLLFCRIFFVHDRSFSLTSCMY